MSPVPTDPSTLSTGECWQRLRSVAVGRIAFVDDRSGIEVFPVNFVVDHGTIVFRTAAGTKLSGVASSPDVVFEADGGGTAIERAWCVVIRATAQPIEVRDDIVDAFDLELSTWHASARPFFVRVVPTSVVGHQADDRSAGTSP